MYLLREKRVTARKPHRCDLCDKVIKPGEEYDSQTIADEGTVYVWKECDRCKLYKEGMYNYWTSYWGDEGYGFYEMSEYMMDEHPDVYSMWAFEDKVDAFKYFNKGDRSNND